MTILLFINIINNKMLETFISQNPSYNFLHYLNRGDNGTKHNLTNQLISLENKWNVPCSAIYLFTKMFDNKVWEIPTNELCEGLIRLFRSLRINKINELAAGNGLLSARLNFFSNKMNHDLQISTSDGTSKVFGSHNFTYTKVNDSNVYDYNKSEPIIISWIHSLFEKELLYSVKKYRQDYIFLVGEHPDEDSYGSNHTHLFHNEMLSYGYDFIILPFKQISQMDYFKHDKIKTNIYHDNRTCTTFYYRNDKKTAITKIIKSLRKNHSNLFGNYLAKNKEYHHQDSQLVPISDEIVNSYIEKNYANLEPIYVFGLKNYLAQKFKHFKHDLVEEYKEFGCNNEQIIHQVGLYRYNFSNVFGSFTCMTFKTYSMEPIWDVSLENRITTKMVQAKFHNNAY
ncbi:hypothetical protein [Acanthamoeba polyphaga mimivirus]|uniref:Uncharacterized protein n=4 Tax=Megamimivirinae TaxID=3044648 RepID=A0A2L2DKP1_MIMIV|nr:hypothetical protein MegaChil _gp1010 [Megavirus chiliensis]AVG46729.1 hypothetical protein [Acanthamoeba polyphaga mimivirus]AVG47848.1 hypothetical protein [Acanthamoeba polyphaga mimivirus]